MDGKPLGIGHASTAISKLNKGLDRALYGCLNGALMSAVNSACKSLDVLRLQDVQERPSPVPSTGGYLPKSAEDAGNEQITTKQQSLLSELIYDRIQNEGEREKWLSQMQTLSKSDAGELISNLLAAPRR